MKFYKFCEYLQEIEELNSRNEITVILAEMIKKFEETELQAGIYLLQGQISPQFVNIEFNFSTKLLLRAFTGSTLSLDDLSKELLAVGDIGLLLASKVRGDGQVLSLKYVYDSLYQIATLSGSGSQSRKMIAFRSLIDQMSPLEAKFCGRIIIGKLRLGVSDKTVLDSLSWAITGDKSLKPLLEKAYGAMADLPLIASNLLFKGKESLEKFELRVGVPVSSKLVEREKDLEKLFSRLGSGLIVQPKYDGLRVQIHYSKEGLDNHIQEYGFIEPRECVRLFSRNMTNITDMFPDVIREVEKLHVDSVVIDSEVIGVDPLSGKLLAFQDTIQRKRKHGVVGKSKQIPVKVFCFDLLYLNGESCLNKPIEKRLGSLKKVLIKCKSKTMVMAESPKITELKTLKSKFDQYHKEGLEGLIAKKAGSFYEPGTRNFDWIKYKVKAQQDLADSFDTVILGYYRGAGVRAKFGIGALLVGVYNPEREVFISIAKVGTGFKDIDWVLLKKKLDENRLEELPKNVDINPLLMPDVLVSPEVVCVVEADEISKSKLHGGYGQGFSLRFPRFKYLRDDKSSFQITTISEVERMFSLSNPTDK